jgi:hypothetical protein
VTVGHRRSILVVGFLALIVALTAQRMNAQQPGKGRGGNQDQPKSGELWGMQLTPDQLKAALSRYSDADLDPLQKMIRDYFKKNPPPQFDPNNPQHQARLNEVLGNKDQMNQLKEIAEQMKGEMGKQGKPPADEDIAKLLKQLQGKVTDQLGLPDGPDPKVQPPTIPPQPNNTTLPDINPRKLPDNHPQPGEDPKPNEPKTAPNDAQKMMPKVIPLDNPQDKGKLPELGNKIEPPEINPFGQPDEPTDARSKSMTALASLWERNVGPLNETPEVKRALFDLASGENGFDFDFPDANGNSFWDLLKNDPGDGSAFSDAFKDTGGGNSWDFPKFDMPTIGWGKWFDGSSSDSSWSKPRPPRMESSSSSGWSFGSSGGIGGISGSWVTAIFLGLLLVGGLLLWWWLNRDAAANASGFDSAGIGPWPIDPRLINTREDVVKAFEYLSVLICGPSAKMWTHGTIAAELTNLAITHGEVAVKLARLYELARYAPLDEPLTRNEVIEARHIVCELAGVV